MVWNEAIAALWIEGSECSWHRVHDLIATARPAWAPVVRCADASSAAAILSRQSFDVALLNLGPGEQELAELDHLAAGCKSCPIIVLSDFEDAERVEICLRHGAADYLAHGNFDGALLVRAIDYQVELNRQRLALEQKLADERHLLRALIDAVPDHVYVKDAQHRFLLGNDATHHFFGLQAGELAGKSDFDFFSADAASNFRREEQQVMHCGEAFVNRENQINSPTGETKWILTTKIPLRDPKNQVAGLVGYNRDDTDRRNAIRQLEQTNQILAERERELMAAVEDLRRSHDALQATQLQLLQVEKMESVGRLAAGIAHEVKNPLAIIATGIEYLSQSPVAAQEAIGRVLGSMSRAVKRADSVIRGLLDFSAPAALSTEPCDLNSVIRQSLVLVDHELVRCHIELKLELPDALPWVSVDANKVEQVFLNLFMNAIHATPAGGSLTIRTRAEQLAALGHNMGDYRAERFRAGEVVVVAEVDDTGHGIPDDKMAKVFDPFFTTKPTGKGTGLGLSVARTIIELHGGMLKLSNRPEGGVRAQLVLKATGDLPHVHN